MQFSSAIEYRRDNAEQLDLTHTETTTWLLRNNFKFQLTPDYKDDSRMPFVLGTTPPG